MFFKGRQLIEEISSWPRISNRSDIHIILKISLIVSCYSVASFFSIILGFFDKRIFLEPIEVIQENYLLLSWGVISASINSTIHASLPAILFYISWLAK